MVHSQCGRIAFVLTVLLLQAAPAAAQRPAIRWNKTFGASPAPSTLTQILQSSDGGILVGGWTYGGKNHDKTDSAFGGSTDFWILKLDTLGQIIWQRTIGGTGGDALNSLAETPDHGLVFAGTTQSESSGLKKSHSIYLEDYWLVRTDKNGGILWDSTYGGFDRDILSSVVAVRSGGYLMAGTSMSDSTGSKKTRLIGSPDYWLVRVNDTGAKMWDKDFGGLGVNYCSAMIQTRDGGFLLGGSSDADSSGFKTQNSRGGLDYWVIKLDSNGQYIWQGTYGGSGADVLTSLAEASDGGYLLGGKSESPVSGERSDVRHGSGVNADDYWVVKVDNAGKKQWDRSYGGGNYDELKSIQATTDGGYVLAGTSASDTSDDKSEHSRSTIAYGDYWVIKTDSLGKIEWDKTLGGDFIENAASIIQTRDCGYVVGGISNSDSSGDKSQGCYGGGDGNVDYWVVALSPVGKESVPTLPASLPMVAEPNPFTTHTTIGFTLAKPEPVKLQLFDITGRTIRETEHECATGLNEIELDTRDVPPGCYWYVVHGGEWERSGKLVKILP